jgi:hypothetical protein
MNIESIDFMITVFITVIPLVLLFKGVNIVNKKMNGNISTMFFRICLTGILLNAINAHIVMKYAMN